MIRPCFLVVDREYASGISTRKLVIETAKFNVITAYSGSEALETLAAFPAVHGVVVDDNVQDMSCREIVTKLKQLKPDLVVVAIGSLEGCVDADHHVESFSPDRLLELLRKLQPVETAAIDKTNQALDSQERDQ